MDSTERGDFYRLTCDMCIYEHNVGTVQPQMDLKKEHVESDLRREEYGWRAVYHHRLKKAVITKLPIDKWMQWQCIHNCNLV